MSRNPISCLFVCHSACLLNCSPIVRQSTSLLVCSILLPPVCLLTGLFICSFSSCLSVCQFTCLVKCFPFQCQSSETDCLLHCTVVLMSVCHPVCQTYCLISWSPLVRLSSACLLSWSPMVRLSACLPGCSPDHPCSVCLPVCLSAIPISPGLSVCLSACLLFWSPRLSVCHSACLLPDLNLSICLAYLSVCLLFWTYLFCLSASLLVCAWNRASVFICCR